MAPVADPLERLMNLLALLLNRQEPLTLDRIAVEMPGYPGGDEARRGAFERDKRALRELGIPIETVVLSGREAGASAYRIDRARYELPDLGLSDDERHALQVALATVHIGVDPAEDALVKLGATDEVALPGVSTALPALAQLPLLFEASTNRAPVTFRYRDEERVLDPYAISSRDGFWYVIGRDHRSGALRTFRVDRMAGGVEAGEPGSFTVPEGFRAEDALPDDPKVIGSGARVEAHVLVDHLRAAKVVREVGDDAVVERRADGAVVVRVPATNLDAFRSWVLGLLDHAEVLDPPPVRAAVRGWLEAMAGA
jgi:proteasome accessory factor B